MALQETYLYINRNIEDVVKVAPSVSLVKVEDEEQTVYFDNAENPSFGLVTDNLSKAEKQWTHLLYADPQDAVGITNILTIFDIQGNELKAATDYSGEPLIDVSKIMALLTPQLASKKKDAVKPQVSQKLSIGRSAAKTPDPKKTSSSPIKGTLQRKVVRGKKWVIIDADGLGLGRLANMIAAKLQTRTMSGQSVEKVVVVNASKLQSRLVNAGGRHRSREGLTLAAYGAPVAEATEVLVHKAVGRIMRRGRKGSRIGSVKVYAYDQISEKSLAEGATVELISGNGDLAKTVSRQIGSAVQTARSDTPLSRITRKL